MAFWLLKTEPGCYSWSDLLRDKKTTWDGVTNATALKNLRTLKRGDQAFIYHTGTERAAVGVAEVISAPYADPKMDDERLVTVDIKPLHDLKTPVTLSDIKADPKFQGWELIRQGRLSVVPVPPKMWKHVLELAGRGVQT